MKDGQTVSSSSDERTANNSGAVRHDYRVLTDGEKAAMRELKDQGEKLLNLIDQLPRCPREKAIAKTKTEEAVMWAVKALTA